jgi:hypothetical protein
MLKDIVHAEPLSHHRLLVRFEDGVEGVVSLTELVPFIGVFEAVADEAVFRQVAVNVELGTIQWPTGADLDPDVLYARITGSHLESATAPSAS